MWQLPHGAFDPYLYYSQSLQVKNFYLHFMDEETEPLKGEAMCPFSLSS